MTDMLEKAAKAIACSLGTGPWELMGEIDRGHFRWLATTTLRAIREPGDWAHKFDGYGTAPATFTAVIDAILNPTDREGT